MYQKITIKNSDHLSGLLLPRLPLLFRIGNEQAKGCNFFYKILRSDNKIARMTLKSETKWQEKLNSNLSVKFWDKILKFPQKMLVPNKLIWTQIQINKYLLPTNYSVHHYDVNVSPLCSFCSAHPEELHLLIWGCGVVQQFWEMVANLITNFYPTFTLGEKEAIFGAEKYQGDSVINTLLILARYFIYQQKFTNKELDEVNFINYTQKHLYLIYHCKKLQNKVIKFTLEWDKLLDHFQII